MLNSAVFPFQIQAGAGNPVIINAPITSSNSIVTVPIYDDTQGTANPVPFTVDQPAITIVGFLQVFINGVDASGNVNVTVLNVAGCSNTATASTPTVSGTFPCADPANHIAIVARTLGRGWPRSTLTASGGLQRNCVMDQLGELLCGSAFAHILCVVGRVWLPLCAVS